MEFLTGEEVTIQTTRSGWVWIPYLDEAAMLDSYAAELERRVRELGRELPCGHKAANLYEQSLGDKWDACPICAMMKGLGERAESAARQLAELRQLLREADGELAALRYPLEGVRAKIAAALEKDAKK